MSGYLKKRCLHVEKTREQQRFTILEVAADWHELMVPRRDMQPSAARDSGQVDPRRINSIRLYTVPFTLNVLEKYRPIIISIALYKRMIRNV